MSKHSMRSGASRSPSAACSSVSALDRALWSAARRSRWRARSSAAERVTVSCRARLAPRWGTATSTGPSRRVREPAQQEVEVGRQLGDQHPAGHLGAHGAVDLRQHQPHELGRAQVLHLLGHEAPVPDHPAPAHVEDLHRRLERVLGDADHVEVLGPLGHHLLGLGRLARHGDAVAQAGGPLELEVLRRRPASAASSRASTGSVSPERKPMRSST